MISKIGPAEAVSDRAAALAGASGTAAAHDAAELQLAGIPGASQGIRFPDCDPDVSASRFIRAI